MWHQEKENITREKEKYKKRSVEVTELGNHLTISRPFIAYLNDRDKYNAFLSTLGPKYITSVDWHEKHTLSKRKYIQWESR